jgi:NADH-quinone oxidoreductase subunit L
VQWDLKRVLAYSTISQLGYMFVALGVLAPEAGMFHLTTQAFFKALLFLAAGSVMHAMGGVIDMRSLGGLAKPLRWTAIGFILGALAMTGFPFFSGYFSKELILERAFEHGRGGALLLVWAAGLATSFVTALYITRAAMLTFAPPTAPDHPDGGHPHEAPPSMAWPMGILALLSVFGGVLGAQRAGAPLLRWLAAFFEMEPHEAGGPLALTLITVAVGLLGIALGYAAYRGRRELRLGVVGVFFERHWGLVPLYDQVITGSARRFAMALADVVEVRIIDGAVNGVAGLVGRAGGAARRLQTGYVRHYAAAILGGTVLLLAYWLLR